MAPRPAAGRDRGADDAWDRVEALNRDPVAAPTRRLTIDLAVLHAQAVYGPGWYWRPGYYPTADGVIPYRWFWVEFAAIESIRAAQQLAIAHAVAVAHADRAEAVRMQERWLALLSGGGNG